MYEPIVDKFKYVPESALICDFIFEIVMKHIPFDGGRA